MDSAGWVLFSDMMAHLSVSLEDVEAVIAHNNKSRFERDGDRIRASQGHSLEGMPVTQEALEASWEILSTSQSCWHGTRIDAVEGIDRLDAVRGARRVAYHAWRIAYHLNRCRTHSPPADAGEDSGVPPHSEAEPPEPG